ncbi:MAG: hypothetical protein IPO61_16620 [Gammaproteobacteria bacterium]|nr:hypothetical protein [Gammaproteobacteria bacterium]
MRLRRYRGLDIEPGPNVDLVVATRTVDGPPESSIDVLISGQIPEHVEFPWLTMEQIARGARRRRGLPGGASAGPEHRHPVDRWRFYPDGMRALARHAGLAVVEVFTDWGLGQWQDSFALLQKPRSGGAGDSALPVFEDRKLAERQYRDPQSRGGEVLPGFYAHLGPDRGARWRSRRRCRRVARGPGAGFPDNAYLRQRQVGVLCALGSPGAALEPGAAAAWGSHRSARARCAMSS